MKNLLSLGIALAVICSLSQCGRTISTTPNYDLERFESEIVAFETFDKTARYRPDAVVFTGSSSIRFWKSLGDDMAPVPSVNRGFGGSTIPEVNHYYDRIITKFRPSIIVLYAGENDIWMDRSVDDVVADYRAFIKKTKAELPNTKVVFLSLKPSPSRWSKWNLYEDANNRIRMITEKEDNQYFIDISKTMMGENGQPTRAIFIDDMLHMNAKGYEGWKASVFPLIKELYNR